MMRTMSNESTEADSPAKVLVCLRLPSMERQKEKILVRFDEFGKLMNIIRK